MKFALSLVILGFGYYTLTYGISLWRKNNNLGGIGVVSLAAIGTIAPLIILFSSELL